MIKFKLVSFMIWLKQHSYVNYLLYKSNISEGNYHTNFVIITLKTYNRFYSQYEYHHYQQL